MTDDEKAKLILTDQWCWECDKPRLKDGCMHFRLGDNIKGTLSTTGGSFDGWIISND